MSITDDLAEIRKRREELFPAPYLKPAEPYEHPAHQLADQPDAPAEPDPQ